MTLAWRVMSFTLGIAGAAAVVLDVTAGDVDHWLKMFMREAMAACTFAMSCVKSGVACCAAAAARMASSSAERACSAE